MENVSLDASHRHHSHLMPLFPLGDISVEGTDDDRRCIEASVRRLERLGIGEWTGWSFPWASLIASRIGRAEMAAYMLNLYIDSFVFPNGFHVNGDWRKNGVCLFHYEPFTMEAECAATAAVTEMLMQSWGRTIRLFPATPSSWEDASFEGLLAEGCVTVSASRRAGEVEAVSLCCPVDTVVSLTGLPETAVWEGAKTAVWRNGIWRVDLLGAIEATARQAVHEQSGRFRHATQPKNIFGLRAWD
jgi:alpha-L-fucosidase 2